MRKGRIRRMYLVFGVVLFLIIIIFIWFGIPFSPVKSEFKNAVNNKLNENLLHRESGFFLESDFTHLPKSIQNYIKNCGYIGTTKMSYLTMEYENVIFKQGKQGPTLTIDYTQYNFVKEPSRLAR